MGRARPPGGRSVQTIAVMTGGFSEQELREAGAVEVYESVGELREALDHTVLRGSVAAR